MLYKCGSIATLGTVIVFGLYGQDAASLPNYVFAGDSLTAGYQNAQLIASGQANGYANVIATQGGGRGVSLNLPLIPAPGYPQITVEGYAFDSAFTLVPPVWQSKTSEQTLDVAVPGFAVADLIGFQASCSPNSPIGVMAMEILNPKCLAKSSSTSAPPTELQEAVSLKPSTAVLWIGANDALFTLLYGTPPTSILSFSQSYYQAATTLAHASKHLVVANIPDVTLTAYLTSVPALAYVLKEQISNIEDAFCTPLTPFDAVTPYAFLPLEARLAGTAQCVPDGSPSGPLVIRAATILQLRATVLAYNAVIQLEAAINGATVVDIYSLVNNLAANGTKTSCGTLTTAFGGGLFSLDGIHPTNTGYAIIANQFIQTMNQSLGTKIPLANVDAINKIDPLSPCAPPAISAAHVTVGMAEGLRSLNGQK